MKILLFGDKGWIGGQFKDYLSQYPDIKVIPACKTGLRADDKVDDLVNLIFQTNIDRLVSMIGRTHGPGQPNIDYLQDMDTLDVNMLDNLYSPLNLAEASRRCNVHFTYLGTGCIFEYDRKHPYADIKHGFLEDDKPNFTGSAYSIVKGFTDRLITHYDNALNLRIRMPITNKDSPRNFVSKILKYPKVISVANSMSVLHTLFPCILSMMTSKYTGTVNLCNPGVIRHNEILELYKKHVDPSYTWENFSLLEMKDITKAGRSNNCLDTALLERLCPNIPNIHDAVEEVMKTWKPCTKYTKNGNVSPSRAYVK